MQKLVHTKFFFFKSGQFPSPDFVADCNYKASLDTLSRFGFFILLINNKAM